MSTPDPTQPNLYLIEDHTGAIHRHLSEAPLIEIALNEWEDEQTVEDWIDDPEHMETRIEFWGLLQGGATTDRRSVVLSRETW